MGFFSQKSPTVATAVLAHSITPTHQLQDRVKVTADWLQAPPEWVHSPVVCVIFGRGAVRSWAWSGCGLLGHLADGSVVEGDRQQQQRSNEGPTGHPEDCSQTERRQRTGSKHTGWTTELRTRYSDDLICGGSKSSVWVVLSSEL